MDIDDIKNLIGKGGIPQWATEETQAKILKALGPGGGLDVKGVQKALGKSGSRDPKTLVGGFAAATPEIAKLGRESKAAQKAFNAFQTTVTGSAGLLATLVQSRGKFSDLNPIIDTVADGMGELAGAIPIVGGFFKALVGFSAEIAKLNNVILDDLIDNFLVLGKQGFGLAQDLKDLQLQALEAGVQFGTLTNAITNNYAGMLAFGGSVEKATTKFASSLTYLTDPNVPGSFAVAMRSFGYGAEEATEFLGEFITRNRNSSRLQQMTDKEVAQTAFEYAKNLRVVAELTGTQVDDLRQAQLAQLQDGAFQSKLQQMRNANLTKEADKMQEFAGQLDTINPAVAKAYKEFIVFGGAATEQTALLMRTIPDLESAFAQQNIEGARNAVANLAKDSDALEVGQLALLDNSNALAKLISDLLPKAQQLMGIVEMGPTEDELRTQQEQQIEFLKQGNDTFDDFNYNLLYASQQLDVMAAKLQKTVVENLGGAIDTQVDVINDALSVLMGMIGGSTGTVGSTGEKLTESAGGAMIVSDTTKARKNFNAKPMLGKFYDSDAGRHQIYVKDGNAYYFDSAGDFVPVPGMAGGGPAGSGLYLVGERGPELLAMDQGSSGYVYNNAQTKKLMGMATPRYSGGGVGEMDGATAQFLMSSGLEGTTDYEGGFAVAHSDLLGVGKDGAILTKIVEDAVKAYKASGKDLKLSDANLDQALADLEFKGNGGAVVGELRNLNKMLKGYMGKVTLRNGYF